MLSELLLKLMEPNGEDILSCKTYDIKLQVCGRYAKISDGSYVKIALGFPEGYGPEDTGTVFKLFHRKHIQGDEYIIEEVPCVMTPFGIVATVESFSPYKGDCPTVKYKDVTTAWYHEAVDYAVTNKVMIGQSDSIWGVGKTITRAETAQIMYNLMANKAIAPAKATFDDVNTDDWFFTAVEWANANGLMVGVGGDKFEPSRPVTRQEFAAVLYRMKTKDMTDKELEVFQKECEAVSLAQFTDAQTIDGWAVDGIKMCVDNGIINGNQAKQLLPKNGTSREEAAQMLMGYLEAN